MTKISKKQETLPEFGRYVDNLWAAFTLMDSKVEIRELMRDLFTHTEYKMFAKRLEIARRLLQEEGYDEIMKDLDVASHSVAAISNILAVRGSGLRKVHQRLAGLEVKFGKGFAKKKIIYHNAQRPTLLGAALKTGVWAASKAVKKQIKRRSARAILDA